jgi:hypothetical protein
MYRKHIIAAAQRHQFIPNAVSQSTREQLGVLYTLAAILYQESHGYEVDQGKILPWKNHLVEWGGALGIRNPSLGICQIRADTTAREIEELGLLYDPGTFEKPNTTAIPYMPKDTSYDQIVKALGGDPEHIKRVERLLDPLWAIEYAAANMELATKQVQYSLQWQSHARPNDVLQPWEKMAGWYARGHFDVTLGEYGKGEQDIKFYLDYTYNSRVAIERLDLLGVRSQRP